MAEPQSSFDLTIIGSGPGGYVAAIRAAQLGLRTALVEKSPLLGGTCLHIGCIPTKALLHSAEVLDLARNAGRFGVKTGEVTLDLAGVHKHKTDVVRRLAKGIEYLRSIFNTALGVDDVESIRSIFNTGNLTHPYASVNVDITKRIRRLDLG